MNLVVLVTRACQLDCVYCRFARSGAMPVARLERCVQRLLEARAESPNLQFLGGEPLLRMDLIEHAAAYARGKAPAPTLSVTTNGLLLDAERRAALRRLGVAVLLSLDGRAAQERNRPLRGGGAYPHADLEANLRGLADEGDDFAVHMVVSPEDARTFADEARRYLDLGAPRVHFQYRIGALWEPEAIKEYFKGVAAFARAAGIADPRALIDANEPAICGPSFTVDVDGEVYQGCTVPAMEEVLPALKRVNRLGNVDADSLETMRARAGRAEPLLESLYPDDPARQAVIDSNLLIGRLSARVEETLRRGAAA